MTVSAALATAQNARTASEAERLSRRLAVRADKPAIPPRLFQVGGAGRVIGKKPLEFGQRLRKRKLVALKDVQDDHGKILALVVVGVNRIGTI